MGRELSLNSDRTSPHKITILLSIIVVLPLFSPLSNVNGEPRVESRDFGVLDELGQMLDERGEFLDSNSVSPIALY